jgi:hypothetical protein
MYSDFIAQIRTVEEMYQLQEEIELLKECLDTKDNWDLETSLSGKVRAKFAEIFRKGLSGSSDRLSYLNGLSDNLNALKVLKMTLAFEPTSSFIDKLNYFVRQNAGKDIILDIISDPTIGGGAIITYEGNYRDFSLVRFMEIELVQRRTDIIKILEEKTKEITMIEPQ